MRRSGKKPVNCIPCAKRKVRCDRLQPCCHCRRRPQDSCMYPVPVTNAPNDGVSPEGYADRVQKLEQYIRSLGGDPQAAGQPDRSKRSTGDTTNNIEGYTHQRGKTSSTQKSRASAGETSSLIAHDEGVSYIQTPMWYTWSAPNQAEQDQSTAASVNCAMRNQPSNITKSVQSPCYSTTLLDPSSTPDSNVLCSRIPPAAQLTALWKGYLQNVHPLVKIFFDWEIEPIIHKASYDPFTLSIGQLALVSAIVLLATLSFSEEQCATCLFAEKARLFSKFQTSAEQALLLAEYSTTSDILVLQALLLYLIAIQDHARPAALFSLLGIASRVAERMGLHRDGDTLGLGVLRSEERRRLWWHLQFMEIAVARLLGTLSLTVYAEWDTKMPANLEDADLSTDSQALPPDRKGLTSMSLCIWRYSVLFRQRAEQPSKSGPSGPERILPFMLSKEVSLATKDAFCDTIEQELRLGYLQYCEPLNPLHVYLQIAIHQFLLAGRRTARQPALAHVKLSTMSRSARDEFLALCTKGMEFYVLIQTTEMLQRFRWHNEWNFKLPDFVYILLEAYHRFADPEATELWSLIRQVLALRPDTHAGAVRPEMAAIARITLAAWQRYAKYTNTNGSPSSTSTGSDLPEWILELCRRGGLPVGTDLDPNPASTQPEADVDFDLFVWETWEGAGGSW